MFLKEKLWLRGVIKAASNFEALNLNSSHYNLACADSDFNSLLSKVRKRTVCDLCPHALCEPAVCPPGLQVSCEPGHSERLLP